MKNNDLFSDRTDMISCDLTIYRPGSDFRYVGAIENNLDLISLTKAELISKLKLMDSGETHFFLHLIDSLFH